jgi:parallel beta-helix repeat protein
VHLLNKVTEHALCCIKVCNHTIFKWANRNNVSWCAANHSLGFSANCNGTTVEGNTFEGNSSGVVLDGAKRLNVLNANRMVSNTSFGLFAKGLSTGTTVLGNTISGNLINIDTSATSGGVFQTV